MFGNQNDELETARPVAKANTFQERIAAGWAWFRADAVSILRSIAAFVVRHYIDFFTKLPWALAIVVIAAILVRGLAEHVLVIQPLSVTKTLAENGYTPEVAAGRLRDALATYVRSANSAMNSPAIALQGDLPSIVVPTVGVSLDAVISQIRSLLRITRSRNISGEITSVDNKLWLRLRIDGRELYSNDVGGELGKPDDLLALAVPAVLKDVQPYFVASALSESDVPAALDMIEWIILHRPVWDPNVAWSYDLRGTILYHRNDYDGAEKAIRQSLKLDPSLAVAHINLGLVFTARGDHQAAIAEYKKAIQLRSGIAIAHNNLGYEFFLMGGHDKWAISELRRAIALDPNYANPHVTLGDVWSCDKMPDDAITEYKTAVQVDPNSVYARNTLGRVLVDKGDTKGAIAQFRAVLEKHPDNWIAQRALLSPEITAGPAEVAEDEVPPRKLRMQIAAEPARHEIL